MTRLRLMVEVEYVDNGVCARDLMAVLRQAAVHLAGYGLLTGGTAAEVDSWVDKVEVVKSPATVKFSVGARVVWRSQSSGYSVVKHGEVVAVVPAGCNPAELVPQGFKCGSPSGFGSPRGHVSYLVKVDGRGRGLYWPREKLLRKEAVRV